MAEASRLSETAISIAVEDQTMLGVLHRPQTPNERAVMIVVGGPQTRVGSHRQFLLLARFLAANGYAVLRFDYRGMGDSVGVDRDFENIDDDLRAAVDCLYAQLPGIRDVVIWGLCDAASAACFYARQDPRVSGLVLLNPWVRTSEGLAKARLKHYYLQRLLSPELWRKIFSGKFRVAESLGGVAENLAKTRRRVPAANAKSEPPPSTTDTGDASFAARGPLLRDGVVDDRRSVVPGANSASEPPAAMVEPAAIGPRSDKPLPERMLAGLSGFEGPVLLVMSGQDLTADEFRDVVKASRAWRKRLADPAVTRHDMPSANHTFSRQEWRDEVAQATLDWLQSY